MDTLIHSPAAGVFKRLSDPKVFGTMGLEYGVVTWPSGIDLEPDAMYGTIKAHGEWVLSCEMSRFIVRSATSPRQEHEELSKPRHPSSSRPGTTKHNDLNDLALQASLGSALMLLPIASRESMATDLRMSPALVPW